MRPSDYAAVHDSTPRLAELADQDHERHDAEHEGPRHDLLALGAVEEAHAEEEGGVVVGLGWGIAAIWWIFVRALMGHPTPEPPDLPDGAPTA